jgi:acyl carrier protein
MVNPPESRSAIIDTLQQMDELTIDQAASLRADPTADFQLAGVNFDSLSAMDFCLRIETATEIVIDPDELVELDSLNALAAVLAERQAASEEIAAAPARTNRR